MVDGKEVRTPAFDVHVEDTTGAGDAFRSGFIAGWLRAGADPNVHDVLRYAHGVAALNCRGLGARDALPRPDEVDELITAGLGARSIGAQPELGTRDSGESRCTRCNERTVQRLVRPLIATGSPSSRAPSPELGQRPVTSPACPGLTF